MVAGGGVGRGQPALMASLRNRREQEAKGIEDVFHPLFIIVEYGMVVG